MMEQNEDALGGWQEQILLKSQSKRLGYQSLLVESGSWETRLRVRVMWVLALLTFSLVGTRVIYLQIFEARQQLLLSESNHLEQVREVAKRGTILDRKGEVLAQSVWDESSPNSWRREYPLGISAASVVGYMSMVGPDELGCTQGLCYSRGMWLGRFGLEKVLENTLRGRDGGTILEVNAKGETVRQRGSNESEAGSDVATTIDAKLQEIMYRVMAETKVNDKAIRGAAVALSLQGEVLGMVSYPSFDPYDVQKYLKDPSEQYFLNRAIAGIYPPGSTFKMITAYAGLAKGVITKESEIEDTGEIKVGEYRYGTWNFDQAGKREGNLNVIRALARSNDIYFYKVGEMVGIADLVKMTHKFGLGEGSGIELTGEEMGLVPEPLWKERKTGEKWFLGNTYHYSIGQGDLLTTPLQVARMTGAAVSGRLCLVHLLMESPNECSDLGIPSEDIQIIREGMKEVCQSGGTAYPFFNFAPYVLCKTGTAQHAGQRTEDDLPHAWITVAYPGDNPEMVLTVLVESGGEGSAVAGPIARRILDEWKTLR